MNFLRTGLDRVVAAMTKPSSEQPAAPSAARQSRTRGGDEPSSRVPPATAAPVGLTGISTGAARDTTYVKKHAATLRNYQEPNDAVDELIASVEDSVRKRDQELKAERSEKAMLVREHNKLQKDYDTQAKELNAKKTRVTFLDSVLDGVVAKALYPYTKAIGNEHRGKWNDKSVFSTLNEMFQDAICCQSLRNQVQSLQDELLAKVEKVQAVSDDDLARDFRNIASLVKALSRTTQPSEDTDMGTVFPQCLLLQRVKPRQWSNRAQKKLYIEAWFWCVLVHFVFQNPFSIFGAEGTDYNKMYMNLFGKQPPHGWPMPTTLSETWRYTTVDRLCGCMGPGVLTSWEEKLDHNILEKEVVTARILAFKAIESVLTGFSSAADHAQIRVIIDKAMALALQMNLQRFRLMVTWPATGEDFDSDRMASIPNIDTDYVDEGLVAFVVNPGLTKYGDAHGKNLDQRYDIVPSLVQLNPYDQGRSLKETSHGSSESGR